MAGDAQAFSLPQNVLRAALESATGHKSTNSLLVEVVEGTVSLNGTITPEIVSNPAMH